MQRQVMSEAAEMASRLDLSRAVVVKPVWHSSLAAAGALVIALILALTAPNYSRIAVARLLHPFVWPAWPTRVWIAMPGALPAPLVCLRRRGPNPTHHQPRRGSRHYGSRLRDRAARRIQ